MNRNRERQTPGRTAAAAMAGLACLAIFAGAGMRTGTAAAPDDAATRRDPIAMAVPGRANANPTVAVDGRFVAVAWGAATDAGATDVMAAASRDGARTFDPPVRVSAAGAAVRLSGEQPPHVVLVRRAGADPSIVVVWTEKAGDGTRLMTARSDDGGRSYGSRAMVAGTDGVGNRGWEAVTANGAGHVLAVWLDHRDTVGQPSSMTHDHAAMAAMPAGGDHADHAAMMADGAEKAQLSKLWIGSTDGSMAPAAITGGVCYCCKTAIATGADGSVFAAWRHVYPGNVRDIAFTVSRDRGRTFAPPVRVSEDRWVLNGCPENGPAMAIDARGRVHLAWPTLVGGTSNGNLALFYASSSDGRTFTRRLRLPTEGTPSHVELGLGRDGLPVIVWDELRNGKRTAVLARGHSATGGAMRFARDAWPEPTSSSSYPVVAAADDGFVVAWQSGSPASAIKVARIP